MEELFRLISDRLTDVISARLNLASLCEIRIRNSRPVRVCYDGVFYYLGETGLQKDVRGAFVAAENDAESVVMRACDRSLYTVTDTLAKGYIAVGGGIRIGVCGSAVAGGDKLSVKDFSSVNIRVPHEVTGCAAGLYARIVSGGAVYDTLIISPPGAGKTTVLRDLCRTVSDRGKNVLLCDEKYEIAACSGGRPTLDVGVNTDVISGADKRAAFEMGVASMRPDVIMADELFAADLEALVRAVHCGISVVATVHARDIADFMQKREYADIISSGIFRRYAVIADAPLRAIAVYDGERAIC